MWNALAVTVALALAAEEAPTSALPGQAPYAMSLTVSGGVSLGSYEAGYLYYLSILFHLNPQVVKPRIFTGASAGSANAMLSLIASCSQPHFHAQNNLFYRSWIPLGMGVLFEPKDVTPIGALSRKPGAEGLARIEQRWNEGLDADCDAVLGLSVTRVVAAPIELTDRVRLPRTSAKFVVRVRGQGPGKPPLLSNYVSGVNEVNRPLLPEDDLGQVEFGALKQALEASAAFPLAFAPRPVNHCPSNHRPGVSVRCPRDAAENALFYDGGVFDNQPLLLATQLARRGLLFDTEAAFRDEPDVSQRLLPPSSRFLYLDPDTELLPELRENEAPPFEAALPYGVFLLGQLIGSARTAELQALLDETPEVKPQLGATLTYYRPLSGALLNFFGFFDTDVRAHDFALGMHDAARFMDEVVVGWFPHTQLVRPEAKLAEQPEEVRETWRFFECLRAVLSKSGDVKRCEGLPRNLLIGAQVTLDKLYARCNQAFTRALKDSRTTPTTAHLQCQDAINGQPPPRVPGVGPAEGWQFEEEEEAFDYQLRRMQKYGYEFRDLGLDPGQSARGSIAKQLNLITQSLGGSNNDVLIKSIGRAYTQSIEYVPPDHALSILVGNNLELAYSRTRGEKDFNWARLHTSLGIEGVLTLVGPDSERFIRLQPRLGVEFEPLPLSSTMFQFRAGARAGFSFSSADAFLSKTCDGTRPCSRPAADVWISATAFQWVRIQIAVEFQPAFLLLPFSAAFRPSLGLEIDWP